jgi:hypothetical protein
MRSKLMVPVVALLSLAACDGGPASPAGMVAFFQRGSCPSGWTDVSASWHGRYVVIAENSFGTLVGTPLSAGENRPTGDHGHVTPEAFYGGNCNSDMCGTWGGGFRRGPLNVTTTTAKHPGETIRPGTNAPYVTLRACVKQ